MKSKTYTENKQPSDKTQSSKFCQLGVKRTRFQNRKKKGNDFFDRSTTLNEVVLTVCRPASYVHAGGAGEFAFKVCAEIVQRELT